MNIYIRMPPILATWHYLAISVRYKLATVELI
jgi:hypothetical protein